MNADPWDELSRRYRHDERGQFLLFVEQMDEARTLLKDARLSKQRLALIAIDGLAEMLLARQQRRIEELRHEAGFPQIPRLTMARLQKLRGDFRARVELARADTPDLRIGRVLGPILDQLDADIFRTAHSYRGRVYHADHHNPTALPLIARAYLGAVGRAFVRQQPIGVAGSPDLTTAKICAYGFDLADSWSAGYFAPREAAEAITQKLTVELEVELDEFKVALAEDIVARSGWAEEMIESIIEDGYPRERVPEVIAEADPWQQIEADEEVVRLEDEIAALKAKHTSNFTEASMHKEAELMEARNERVFGLRAELKPSVTVDDIPRIGVLGAQLRNAKNVGALFNRYRKLDDEIELIERILEELAIGWDRHLQEELDRIRGK